MNKIILNRVNLDGFKLNPIGKQVDKKDFEYLVIDREFKFDKTAGGKTIKDGAARIEAIKGNSVVWNQLINNILSGTTYQKAWHPRRGVNYASVQDGVIELRFDSQSDAFGNSLRQQIDVRPGDHIYISYDYESHNVDEFGRRAFMAFTARWSYKAALSDNCLAKGGEVVGHAEGFSVVPSDNSIDTLCIYFCYTNIASPDTTPLKIANFRFVNLTRMFGAGNEPTTIEEFYARKPLGIDEYTYNEGEVIHMNAQKIESVGVNQWDEEWVNGYYDATSGNFVSAPLLSSKNAIPVIGNMFAVAVNSVNVTMYIYCYNANGYLGRKAALLTNLGTPISFIEGTTHFHFTVESQYGSAYKGDICINLSDPSVNGKYFPYVKREQSLDIIGKYFPNGMKSAGTAHDEIRYNKTTQKWESVKRIGSVDMSTLGWVANASGAYGAAVSGILPAGNNYVSGIIQSRYAFDTSGSVLEMVDKSIRRYGTNVYIKDTSYTDVASLRASLQGVMLYYELAEPIVTEIDETFNLDYPVWNVGTENAVADTPSTPLKADIRYKILKNKLKLMTLNI